MGKFKSIRNKIIVIGLISTISLAAVLISVSYYLSEKAFTEVINEKVLNDVKNYSSFLGNWFDERIREMETYGHNPTVKRFQWDEIKTYLKREIQRKSDIYYFFFVADRDGNYYTTLDDGTGDISDREYFYKVMLGESVVSNPVISKTTGEKVFVIAVPIKDNDEKVIGLIGGTIKFENLYKFIENFKVNEDNSYSYIVDKEGYIITHPDKDKILNFNVVDNLHLIDKDYIENFTTNINRLEKGVIKYTFEEEINYGYFNIIPNTDKWRIVTKIPRDYLVRSIRETSQNLLFVGIISIILSVFFSIYGARTISEPIVKLKDIIIENAKGNMKKANINSNDEIGVLAGALNHMMEVISELTYYDPLTKLPTRKLFDEQLDTAIAHCIRNGESLGVMIIGIDKFKHVNDAFGLSAGDEVLKKVSKRIREGFRQEDVFCRITGDEFAVFFPEINREKDVVRYAEDIIQKINKPFIVNDDEIIITASAGIAFYPKDGDSRETLIRNANIALHKVKGSGGGSYQLFNSTMKDELLDQIEIEKMLSQAMDKEEFKLYYQPIVDMESLEIVGMEALIRWEHPILGMISPEKFIPIAEENGLIIPLGKWVLKTACSQNKKWQDQGLKKIFVSVNISIRQFQDENFVNMIRDILGETKLDPQYLGLEITESIAMENEDYTIKVLKKLKDMGIKVAIDDFGTGYSSMGYLTKLPIDTLKIDKSFIFNAYKNKTDASIASTIITMGHNLDLKVTAEGVERPEQLEYLKNQRCDSLQGYLFSKPVDNIEFEKILRGSDSKALAQKQVLS